MWRVGMLASHLHAQFQHAEFAPHVTTALHDMADAHAAEPSRERAFDRGDLNFTPPLGEVLVRWIGVVPPSATQTCAASNRSRAIDSVGVDADVIVGCGAAAWSSRPRPSGSFARKLRGVGPRSSWIAAGPTSSMEHRHHRAGCRGHAKTTKRVSFASAHTSIVPSAT